MEVRVIFCEIKRILLDENLGLDACELLHHCVLNSQPFQFSSSSRIEL